VENPEMEALNNSAQPPLADPEILPEIIQTEDDADSPEEKAADISLYYTLTEELQGDNNIGYRDKRNDGGTKTRQT
jgi:hypothetical protein